MTMQAFVEKHLTDNGMFPQDAAVVVDSITDEDLTQWGQRRGDDLSGYHHNFVNLLRAVVNRIALRWIDEHAPKAWYRPMFDPEQLAEILKEKTR